MYKNNSVGIQNSHCNFNTINHTADILSFKLPLQHTQADYN